MPSLKDLKNRITSVTSTRKITSAMKMVAASKFRRAQEQVESARPYAQRLEKMLNALASRTTVTAASPRLLAGTGKAQTVLLLVVTSDRGLCGAFNSNVVRETRRQIAQLTAEGKTVKLFFIGRKGRDLLRRDHGDKILGMIEASARRRVDFSKADALTQDLLTQFEADGFDVLNVIYNKFLSVLSQVVTVRQLVPVQVAADEASKDAAVSTYDFEPDEEALLAALLPHNLASQIFATMLESTAGEHGARMTAMDNASRNAGDMIKKLTLTYNRSRQAYITKELIEIISGAEAV